MSSLLRDVTLARPDSLNALVVDAYPNKKRITHQFEERQGFLWPSDRINASVKMDFLRGHIEDHSFQEAVLSHIDTMTLQ